MSTVCARCGRTLNRNTIVHTRVGPLCEKCADRLPPHLRRPPTRKEPQR
jgi:recombinational DNA repair protein (RecF pathway)